MSDVEPLGLERELIRSGPDLLTTTAFGYYLTILVSGYSLSNFSVLPFSLSFLYLLFLFPKHTLREKSKRKGSDGPS